jgi:hypothetical protein
MLRAANFEPIPVMYRLLLKTAPLRVRGNRIAHRHYLIILPLYSTSYQPIFRKQPVSVSVTGKFRSANICNILVPTRL